MSKRTSTLLFCLLICIACQNQAPAADSPGVEVAEITAEAPTTAPTQTARPTESSPPTATTTPSRTPTSTTTPSSTPTATATHSPTPSTTPTQPPTATATRVPFTPTTAVVSTPIPPTATAAPVAGGPLPAQGAAPSGPNLLTDPGLEYEGVSWEAYYWAMARADQPRLGNESTTSGITHSGNFSITFQGRQAINDVASGQTYRFGMWAKIWVSGEGSYDAPVRMRVCANGHGNDNPALGTSTCGSWATPMNQWQYLVVDVQAVGNRLVVMTQVENLAPGNPPPEYIPTWDDGYLGVSPVQATAIPLTTPTPAPPSPPVRPPAQPFETTAVKNSLNTLRANIEQLGGLLDRLYSGSRESCQEFNQYYNAIGTAPFYNNVPAEWAGIHGEYQFAAEHVANTNFAIFSLCGGGGGGLSPLNYGVARQGINDALSRLIPAVDAANGMP